MKVAISGDLKGSRTIHSFVYALARFGATIDPLPAPGMELPAHVDRRLREEFHCRMVSKDPGQPQSGRFARRALRHRRPAASIIALSPIPKSITACWCRRRPTPSTSRAFKRSAGPTRIGAYPKIDAKFLGEAKYSDASVMHPLPRVNELDASFDTDRRAVYFQQAAYGVPIRMALISLLLHLHKNKSLDRFGGGFAKPEHPVYAQPIGIGLQCDNPNCITGDPAERQYAANKFYVIEEDAPQHGRLRCVYCEKDVDDEAARDLSSPTRRGKHFRPACGTGSRARRQAQASCHSSQRRRSAGGGFCAARERRQESARRLERANAGACVRACTPQSRQY